MRFDKAWIKSNRLLQRRDGGRYFFSPKLDEAQVIRGLCIVRRDSSARRKCCSDRSSLSRCIKAMPSPRSASA